MGLGLGIVLEMLGKLCGMCGYAAFAAIASLLVDFLATGTLDNPFTSEIILGIGIWYIVALLISWLEFLRVRRFLKKGGYEECIRNDTPSMTNAYRAFGLKRTRSMLRYISRLNPASGKSLKEAIKRGTTAKWQRRLRYLPYMVILAAAYYLIPRLDMLPLYSDHWFLIVEHLVTLVVMIIYARKNCKDFEENILEMVLVVTAIFALMFFVYYSSEMWYHILICAVIVAVSFFFG